MPASELAIVIKAQDETTAALRAVRSELRSLAGTVDATNKSVTNFGGSLRRVGETAAGFIAANVITRGFEALKNSITDSIRAASDLNESVAKSRAVFGPLSADLEAFAQNSARTMGLSRRATIEATATFGNLFTAMKISQPVAAEMSKELVKLASDLASFNNIGTEEALLKIRAGLVGEIEPLRSVGVNLNQVAIEQRAVTLGLIKQGEALTPAAKAQAAYSIILEQTTTAQGDFARTADGLANRTRRLAASFDDVRAILGEKLAPVQARVLGQLADFLERPSTVKALTTIAEAAAGIVQVFAAGFQGTVIPALQWIGNNSSAVAAAVALIGVAFAWAMPGGAILLGLNSIILGVGLLRSDLENLPIPLLQVRLAFLDFALGATSVIETVGDALVRAIVKPLDLAIDALNAFIRGLNTLGSRVEILGTNVNPLAGVAGIPEVKGNFGERLTQGPLPARADLARDWVSTQSAIMEAQERVAESAANIIPPLTGMGLALDEAGDKARSFGDRLRDTFSGLSSATSALFGRPTREEAQLELRLAQLEARGPQIDPRWSESVKQRVQAEFDKERNAITERIRQMQAENRIQQLQIQLADQTLLTEQEQAQGVRELIQANAELSTWTRNAVESFHSLVPGLAEATREAYNLAAALRNLQPGSLDLSLATITGN